VFAADSLSDFRVRLPSAWFLPRGSAAFAFVGAGSFQDETHRSINLGAPYQPPGLHEFRPVKGDKAKFAGKKDWLFV
jgi:hypothetical protein